MSRYLFFLYGLVSYAIFFVTFLYAIGFMGNIVVPKSIDSGPQMSVEYALLINLGLLVVFAVQHSVMARPQFKQWWTRFIPVVIERSTYVLLSSLALILLFYFWQPMGGVIWSLSNPLAVAILYAVFALGWLLVLIATFLINHFDLFGLRQVYLHLLGREYTPLPFATPWLYRYVRHPLYLGWLLAFWATPTMTAAHLFFAVVTTVYIFIAIQMEERDLASHFGKKYEEYSKTVPMIIPLPKGRRERMPDAVE